MFATPTAADEQRDRAEAEEQAVERGLGVGLGDEGGRGLADVDLARDLGVGRRGEHRVDGVDLVLLGTEVDLGRVPVEAEVASPRPGNPTSTEESISGASTAGLRMPAT